jgi:hypothetical protein
METKPLINKVAQKALVTLDLEELFPKENDIAAIDLKDYLFKGLILRESDFRTAITTTDWSVYKDKLATIYCSANAIVPMWAYMVISAELAGVAKDVAQASPDHAAEIFLYRQIAQLDMTKYTNQRVVVKGCGDRPMPEAAYVQIAAQLAKVARVIMYGEPCSTVPVFKKAVD